MHFFLSYVLNKKRILIGYVVRAVRRRLLEYAKASALRTPLAGLTMFATCLLQAEEKPSPRLRRPTCRSFELRFDLNRPHSPACPTSPGISVMPPL